MSLGLRIRTRWLDLKLAVLVWCWRRMEALAQLLENAGVERKARLERVKLELLRISLRLTART